jgi:Glycosyl hydrolases family 6
VQPRTHHNSQFRDVVKALLSEVSMDVCAACRWLGWDNNMQAAIALYAKLIRDAEGTGAGLVRGLATDIANYTPRERSIGRASPEAHECRRMLLWSVCTLCAPSFPIAVKHSSPSRACLIHGTCQMHCGVPATPPPDQHDPLASTRCHACCGAAAIKLSPSSHGAVAGLLPAAGML